MATSQSLKKLYPSLLRPVPLVSLEYRSRNDKPLRAAALTLLFAFTLQFSAFSAVGGSADLCGGGAEEISSKELIDNANYFDGKRILYKGELITAVLNRGDNSWINLNDGGAAIGVWCREGALGAVTFIGDYKNKGDVLAVEGVFHRACPVHGGELDIHAGTVKVLRHGYALKERVDKAKLNISIALFLAAILIIAVFKKRL